MIEIDIPGFRTLNLEHLVLDFNGTLAVDGRLLDGVAQGLCEIANELHLHVVTGNTYGDAREHLRGLPVEVICLQAEGQAIAKSAYVRMLGKNRVAAVGNGRNDAPMLEQAALGIAILGTEGLATDTLNAADVTVRHAVDAMGLLLHPKRLIATLRS
ncbi:HAD family hydrolase [Paraburkholderia bannensis]|uniref:HAD family hydrolase n=1 Tax=Paraburkholderia bannensis TaxID=765414 RepID=UPI002ABD970F|nr:hypothetical protein [Paraburkholderia bannensis]